jgi:hypothetical protein
VTPGGRDIDGKPVAEIFERRGELLDKAARPTGLPHLWGGRGARIRHEA